MSSDTVISVENLSKSYLIGHDGPQERYHSLRDTVVRHGKNYVRKAVDMMRGRQIIQGDEVEEFWALKDVSFEVKRGEVLGIIGRNGAGKSTLLKILSRITEPTSGRVTLNGRVASLLEVGTGFHPELTGRENIFLNGAILGMSKVEIRKKFDEIVDFAGVEKFLDTPVKRYSSGMYVRLAFAVAAHLEPEILIIDEVLAVGDAEFQKKCLGKMQDVAKVGRTVLFVSHNLSAITNLTSRAIFLDRGKLEFSGAPHSAIEIYSKIGREKNTSTIIGRGKHASVITARIVDEYGEMTRNYDCKGALIIEIVLEKHDSTPDLSVELFLLDSARNKIGLASLYQFYGKNLPIIQGQYKTIFKIEAIHLASGIYTFDISTSVVNTRWDHYVEDALEFIVIHSSINGQPWDFKQSLGFGSIALTTETEPIFSNAPIE